MSLKNNKNTNMFSAAFNVTVAGFSFLNGAAVELTETYSMDSYENAKKAKKSGTKFVQANLGTLETQLFDVVYDLKLAIAAGKQKKATRLGKEAKQLKADILALTRERKADKAAKKSAGKSVKRARKAR